jgi:hypothetical protein
MYGKIEETGNVLSTIESQGLRKQMASATSDLKLVTNPSGGVYRSLKDASSRKSRRKAGRKDSRKVLP